MCGPASSLVLCSSGSCGSRGFIVSESPGFWRERGGLPAAVAERGVLETEAGQPDKGGEREFRFWGWCERVLGLEEGGGGCS